MCGIVGYIGENDAKGILLNGLEKLEYRGMIQLVLLFNRLTISSFSK